jgi:hypothetical protein
MNKLLASVLLLVVVAAAPGAEDESKAVLAQAQGTWFGTQKMDDNKTYRMEKTIEGNKETVCLYDGDKLAYKWTVDFEIKKTDTVTVFTFRNLKVTDGPQKGTTFEGPVSYLFQIRDDKWIQVLGVMNGDKGGAELNTLERKKAKADPGTQAK